MITNFSIKRFLLKTLCSIVLFATLCGIGGILYQSFLLKTQPNIANSQLLSRAITEREIVVSNRTFSVKYEYSTNVVPYTGPTNIITVTIRRAVIDVFEIIGTNRVQIDGTMRGNIVMTGNFDKQSDKFYVLKALASTN